MKIKRFPLILGIVFLICTAFLISPVAAKPGDNPDPVCEICTKLNDIIKGLKDTTMDIQGVNTNVSGVKTDVAGVNTNLNNWFGTSGEYENVQKMISGAHTYEITSSMSNPPLVISSDKPFKITINIFVDGMDDGEQIQVIYNVGGGPAGAKSRPISWSNNGVNTIEMTTDNFYINIVGREDGYTVAYSYVVEYSGDPPTITPTP